jgi:hypothetical protein
MESSKPTKRKRFAKAFGWAIVTPISFYLLFALLPWSCNVCREENKGEVHSPNGKHLARIYQRNCGATTGLLTHVNLRSNWDYFNTGWVGTITQGQVFSIGCDTEVNLVWVNDNNLEIQYRPCERRNDSHRVLLKDKAWGNLTIRYIELNTEEKN